MMVCPLHFSLALLSAEALSDKLKDVHDWFTLGVNLRMEPSVLEGVLNDPEMNQWQRKEAMLAIWLESHPSDPLGTLINALRGMEEEDTAGRIRVTVTGPYKTASCLQPQSNDVDTLASQVQPSIPLMDQGNCYVSSY